MKDEIANLKKTIEDQTAKIGKIDNEQDLLRKTAKWKEDQMVQQNNSLQKINTELKSEF